MNNRIIKYSSVGIILLAVIVFGLLIYSKSLNKEVKEGTLTEEQLTSLLNTPNTIELTENTESASTEIGKSVNEVSNEMTEKNDINNNTIFTTTSVTSEKNNTNVNTSKNILSTQNVAPTSTTNETKEKKSEETTTVELNFEKPVEGEIIRDFAQENLIYSETLQEWTTHTGIDIKADKTTVVKAAEAGTVKTIKNDPRYGLTVVVEHANGFQTVYSNLLTSEFVVEGEKVEKGQSLGTVGNTAAFEIADEPHLHFEILKDFVQVEPNIYIK